MTDSSFVPLTAIDCTIPALLIDRNAPLDVLHANAAARVLAVTQLMESFSSREVQEADSVDLKHMATVSAQLLRDGCDLLDVVAVINAVLGIQPLPAADVNGDGAVNALDVVFVINRVLEIPLA